MSKQYRIKVIVPICESQYNDEVFAVVNSVAPPDLSIEVDNIKAGTSHIQGRFELIRNSLEVVRSVVQAEKDGFDGVFVTDFDMCGVEAAREVVDIPVIGGYQPSAFLAMSLSHRFSIVTILDSVRDLQAGHADGFGIAQNLASVHSIGLEVEALLNRDAVVNAVFDKALMAVTQHGASSILLGCTGFMGVADQVEMLLQQAGYPALVIDPNKAAISFLYMIIRNGKSQSRMTYHKPDYVEL